jgi:hypothetical protein
MSHGFTAQAGSVFNKGLNASRVCTLKIDLRIFLIRSRQYSKHKRARGMQMLGLPTFHGRFWQQLSPLQLVVIMIGKAIMI